MGKLLFIVLLLTTVAGRPLTAGGPCVHGCAYETGGTPYNYYRGRWEWQGGGLVHTCDFGGSCPCTPSTGDPNDPGAW